MKNLISILAIAAFCTLFSGKLAAQAPQCSFQLVNAMGCTVSGTVDWYDNCSGAPCDSQPFSVGANSSQGVTCSGCGTLCNVVVTVLFIGTAAPSGPGTVDNGVVWGFTDSGSVNPACSGVSTYFMSYAPAVFNINP